MRHIGDDDDYIDSDVGFHASADVFCFVGVCSEGNGANFDTDTVVGDTAQTLAREMFGACSQGQRRELRHECGRGR